jgi:hypothetical protein
MPAVTANLSADQPGGSSLEWKIAESPAKCHRLVSQSATFDMRLTCTLHAPALPAFHAGSPEIAPLSDGCPS